MYDTATWSRVVPSNKPWISMTEDQLLNNMQKIWDKPQNCAVSHLKAGIAQLQSRGILTAEEAEACLKETLKMRSKAQQNERNNHE